MSTPASSLVSYYQDIANISSAMLHHAQDNHWDEVINLSTEYIEAVNRLKQLDPLTTQEREARRQLLTQILDDDARIRHLVHPELERLNALLGNLKRQQNVLQAYGSTDLSHA